MWAGKVDKEFWVGWNTQATACNRNLSFTGDAAPHWLILPSTTTTDFPSLPPGLYRFSRPQGHIWYSKHEQCRVTRREALSHRGLWADVRTNSVGYRADSTPAAAAYANTDFTYDTIFQYCLRLLSPQAPAASCRSSCSTTVVNLSLARIRPCRARRYHCVHMRTKSSAGGTFSQRHAMLWMGNWSWRIGSSSEMAVLGARCLEAQFSDFLNGAQDTVVLVRKKWLRRSGIVFTLAHGRDGARPERSSLRIEKMFQLTYDRSDVNSGLAYINIYAHYFPKSTPARTEVIFISSCLLNDNRYQIGHHLKPVFDDPFIDQAKATRVVMRVEDLAPFLFHQLISWLATQ
ncbi:hypothetical protein GALMADRAFT_142725 [Galerina marginata CBS 339.88]|uniref:Uncharacterized protein n=1 Tax=Galerina marginata (strain CBS 339.88) TaxID=685588 RepID=A0A067SQ17_GALM3|nr:hypothetical protein GALMADRAFT_142725 [Galerina marginata CBS 339.88]